MILGYARRSPFEVNIAAQLDALHAVPCDKVFADDDPAAPHHPGFQRALDAAQAGDVLVIDRLHRLAQTLPGLLDRLAALHARGVEIRAHADGIDTTAPGGWQVHRLVRALGTFSTVAALARQARPSRPAPRRGKPPSLTAAQVEAAARRLADPSDAATVDAIAAQHGVHRATLFRALSRYRRAQAAG